MNKRLIAFLPLGALVALACLFAFYALKQKTTRIEPDFTVGKPAPAMMLSYLEGGPPMPVLADIKGPAVVNIFGSWCTGCVVETQYLKKLHDAGVRIIGLDQGQNGEADPPEDIAAFLKKYDNPYAVIFADPKGQALIDYGATGVPESFVVDSKGLITGKISKAVETQAEYERILALVKAAR